MASVYSDIFIDHLNSPRNMGELAGASGVGAETNPVCGDVMKLAIRVENGTVADARYVIKGCTASIAAASMLTELIIGLPVGEARTVKNADIADALGGLPLAKLHSAALAEGALRRALADYTARQTAPSP